MHIAELMTPDTRCLAPEDSLVKAATLMRRLDVHTLPVCHHGRLLGIVIDRDIGLRAIAEGYDPLHTPVRRAMTVGNVHVFAQQILADATHLMEEHQIRRLPVLDRDHHLLGVIAWTDIERGTPPRLAVHSAPAPAVLAR